MAASQSELVRQTLTWLARSGVREVCVAAGARNAPLVAALSRCSSLTLRHFFEERCAAFFALGRAMMHRAPVAVVTTSGTAAAELLPAMIEAHYQGLPLIAVTADRPKSYRGTGAPQAIEQAGLFGRYAEGAFDIDVESPINVWEVPAGASRPTHLNLCLDEPLDAEIDGIDFAAMPSVRPRSHAQSDAMALASEWLRVQRPDLVVTAGLHPDDAAILAPALRSLGVPVFAEATANLGAQRELASLLVPPADTTIATLRPRAILRIGAVPSGRWWRDLEDQSGTRVLNLTPTGLPGLARARNVTTARLDSENVASLLIAGSSGGRDATVSTLESPASQRTLSNEQAWLEGIAEIVPNEALVFLGNSLPIREWNAVVGNSRPFRTFANRGANGIDGLVSTFLGLAADEPESWLILGDLSALYDLAAPWILGQLPTANRRIVILNNGGGRIFSKVASLQELPHETRAMLENDHALSFAPWAALWDLPYQLAQDPGDLSDLPDGPRVIEIQTQA